MGRPRSDRDVPAAFWSPANTGLMRARDSRGSTAAFQGVHAALDVLAALNPCGLSGQGQADLLRELKRIGSRVDGIRLRVLAAAERARTAEKAGAADTGSWAAKNTNDDSRETARAAKLATRIKDGSPTRRALDEGEISQQHAEAIVGAGEQLPEDLTPAERARVEDDLVGKAKTMSPQALRRQARRQLEALNKEREEVDAHEEDQVAGEEQRARAKTTLTMHDNGDGTVSGYFTLPVFHANLLRKLLQTMTAPRRTNGTGTNCGAGNGAGAGNDAGTGAGAAFGFGPGPVPGTTGAGDNSGAGARAADEGGLFSPEDAGGPANPAPHAGGPAGDAGGGGNAGAAGAAGAAGVAGAGGKNSESAGNASDTETVQDLAGLPGAGRMAQARRQGWAHAHGLALMELIEHLPTDHLSPKTAATIVVTLDEQVLRGYAAAAGLDTGERISAAHARQLACNSGIIPVVMGGKSLPLDLGRGSRLFTETQRTALATRHRECAADGCTRPFAWCELHHAVPWSKGGRTDLDNAVPLCHRHHRMAHDHRYHQAQAPDGNYTFTMRAATMSTA